MNKFSHFIGELPDCLLLFIIVEKMQDTRATAVGDYISTSARD